MSNEKLNPEQIKRLRTYFTTLNDLSGSVIHWTDEELAKFTGLYTLIDKLGEGDPIQAAIRHRKALDSVMEAIKLTSSDRSVALH